MWHGYLGRHATIKAIIMWMGSCVPFDFLVCSADQSTVLAYVVINQIGATCFEVTHTP